MKAVRRTFKWIRQHINFILLILVIVQCILSLHQSMAGVYAERAYKRQQIENQIQIEKAETDKELAVIEAEKEAEVTRIKSGAASGGSVELP